ncbi:MAG TPA: HAD-IA family hydrolase [Wenzhouxiangella sp.]|nr:HAD-IA family hydrolase [Wenzhouxiangella sp.]
MSTNLPAAVLFDLDGTLIDSAPDLVLALNRIRAERGLDALGVDMMREFVSRGARGLLKAGMPDWADMPADRQNRLLNQLLDYYEAACWVKSRPFDGIPSVMKALEERGIAMGIVTNKVNRFARPVLEQAGWSARFGCLVAGDSTNLPKPAPEPVLMACELLEVPPGEVFFVGDDKRDVLAGAAAGTRTVVAAWGYLPAGDNGTGWGADRMAKTPADLLTALNIPGPVHG